MLRHPALLMLTISFMLLGSCASTKRDHAATARPNIVFILLDNLGKEWVGCYGSQENVTPEIDRLAAAGVRVENCYTPVVCGPSRIVALTGRYLLRSGMTLHHDAALYSGGGVDPRKEITFARPLRDAGYRTAIAGKWQINNLYDEPGVLKAHGFDASLVCPMSIDRDRVTPQEHEHFMQRVLDADADFTSKFIMNIESRYWDPVLMRDGVRETHAGRFGPDVVQAYALEFLRKQRSSGGPFLLYYPMFLTHGKYFIEHTVETPENRGREMSEHDRYAAMVRYADRQVGEVVEELRRLGLLENTIVFIATDNGTHPTISARAYGRTVAGGLYTLSEPGGNVPLIVYSPRLVPGGRTMKLADFSDLLPTFCELAGTKPPADRVIDGRSFAGYLLGHAAREPRTWIFNQYGDQRLASDGRYKLWGDGRLYVLKSDFHETVNLANSADPQVNAARQRLQVALDSLPPDAPPPFKLRSQSAFRLEQERRRELR